MTFYTDFNFVPNFSAHPLLRRLRGGGQSARSSLNVIDWRHNVEYGSLKLAFILCYFAKLMIYSFGNN